MRYASRIVSPANVQQLLRQLRQIPSCGPTDSSVFLQAQKLGIELVHAVQLIAASRWDLDGIVTNRCLAYRCAEFTNLPIFTPGQLVADYFDRQAILSILAKGFTQMSFWLQSMPTWTPYRI